MAISKSLARKKVWARSKGKCWFCGIKMVPASRNPKAPLSYVDRMFTFDHLLARSRGGSEELSNLIGCCRKCNNLKAEGSIDFLRMRMMVMENKWPHFSIQQYEFLFDRGINLGRFGVHQFYFEKAGLK